MTNPTDSLIEKLEKLQTYELSPTAHDKLIDREQAIKLVHDHILYEQDRRSEISVADHDLVTGKDMSFKVPLAGLTEPVSVSLGDIRNSIEVRSAKDITEIIEITLKKAGVKYVG